MKKLALVTALFCTIGSQTAFAANSKMIADCVKNSTLEISHDITVNQYTKEREEGNHASLTCNGEIAHRLYMNVSQDAQVRKIRDENVHYAFFGKYPSLTKCLYNKETVTYSCVIQLDILQDILFQ